MNSELQKCDSVLLGLLFCSNGTILICTLQVTHGPINNYTCEIREDLYWPINTCVIHGRNSTSTQKKYFQLVPNNPVNEIKGVRFISSKVEVLTSDVCETLPIVTYFLAWDAGLMVADENAFAKCTKLDS